MKKIYQKPEILFESFALSTCIAANCGSIVGAPTDGVCGIAGTGGDILFSEEITGCTAIGDDNLFCYHVPTDSTNLFNS